MSLEQQPFHKKQFNPEELNHYLVCRICDGYFRFAHTIADCGHTFCYDCLKANQVKSCPTCNLQLNQTVVKKDPFKQNIVDLLYPQFQKNDKVILTRMKNLFGDDIDEFQIQNLMQENNYFHHSQKKKQKLNNEKDSQLFNNLVTDSLSMTMEQFKRDIQEEEKYEQMEVRSKKRKQAKLQELQEQKMKFQQQLYRQQQIDNQKPNPQEQCLIDLRPKSQQDFEILNLKCKLKVNKVIKPKRLFKFKNYLYKQINKEKVLLRGQVVENLMCVDNVQLLSDNNILNEDDFMHLLINAEDEPIQIEYNILFKNKKYVKV